MRQRSSFHKSFQIKWHYFLLLIFVAVSFSALVFIDNYFTIRTVEVLGSNMSLLGLHNWDNKNILIFKESDIATVLLTANPYLKKVTVSKKYPSTLVIKYTTNVPFAYFVVNEGYFILSDDGRILGKVKQIGQQLPKINYYQKLNYTSWQSGDYLQYKDILSAVHFLKTSIDLGLMINTIDINGLDMIALQLQARKILLTTEKDASLQDYQLGVIIRQFKIEGKDFSVLDLRFDKPVIQFK